jgi:hypothetical protein
MLTANWRVVRWASERRTGDDYSLYGLEDRGATAADCLGNGPHGKRGTFFAEPTPSPSMARAPLLRKGCRLPMALGVVGRSSNMSLKLSAEPT